MNYLFLFKNKKGVSIFFAVIILSVLLAMALALSTILVVQSKMLKEVGESVVAFYAADTGVEEVLYKDKMCYFPGCGPECLDPVNCDKGIEAGSFSGSLGQASYFVEFNDAASYINSKGSFEETSRAIEVSR